MSDQSDVMPPVPRPKETALDVPDDVAVQVADTALAAIDTLLNLSMWALGVLALVLAVVALFGWGAIRSAAVAKAKQIAGERLDKYIKGQEFSDLLTRKLEEAVERRWQNTVVIRGFEAPTRQDGESEFPSAKENEDGTG